MNAESASTPKSTDDTSQQTSTTETAKVKAGDREVTKTPPPSPPPPKGPSLKIIMTVLLVAIVALWIGMKFGARIESGFGTLWSLVMPASNTGDGGDPGATTQPVTDPEFYTCGMHPWVILPGPGLCPVCQMDLTPVDPSKFTGEISIDPVITQSIGVRIEPVISGPLVQTIRTVGTIDYDETTVRDVNIKVSGWIEKLYVNFLGAEIRKGDPLFDFYSPDLYVAQEAFLRALKDLKRLEDDASPDIVQASRDMADSARIQLEYYDVTPQQIEQMSEQEEATKTLTVISPHTGVVIEKHANEGMRVENGMKVYRIADLSKVWVMVTLYEYQLPFVQEGQEAVMTLPYIPGQEMRGEVIYIYPYLDKKTRQVNVRLEFENSKGLLKPGMYANIELKNTLASRRTLAPRSAVIDTGERQVAFVSLGDGLFEPREVRLGVETDAGMVEILDGLEPDEMVVTSGQFLLDSEAKIREGLAKMVRGDLASEQGAIVASAGASELNSLPMAMQDSLGAVLDTYFDVSNILADDSIESLASRASDLVDQIDTLLGEEIPENEHFWHEHDEINTAREMAVALQDAEDIEAARLVFADLSIAFSKLSRATGIPEEYGREVYEFHCPMYRAGQGGSIWLQPKGDVRNPFMGLIMLECFDDRSVIPMTGEGSENAPPYVDDKKDNLQVGEGSTSRPASVHAEQSVQEQVDEIQRAYLVMHDLLTKDSLDGFSAALESVASASEALSRASEVAIQESATKLSTKGTMEIGDLETARTVFEEISMTIMELYPHAPPSESLASTVYHVYCPMVKKSWLQVTREVANPYAPYMLECGTVKGIVAGQQPEENQP